MSKVQVQVGNVTLGGPVPFLMAGPCVVEDEELMLRTADGSSRSAAGFKLPVIYKSSFMKDNRSDLAFDHGPGLDEGLAILRKVKERSGLPILTDVHYPEQVAAAADVADVLQIPAYLCMQIAPAGERGADRAGGQPEARPVPRAGEHGQAGEEDGGRGLAQDRGDRARLHPRLQRPGGRSAGLPPLPALGYPVVFDIGHSVRRYGIPSADPRGGLREFMPVLARAAVAAGVDGLFIETHPDPARAHCDAASQYPLDTPGGLPRSAAGAPRGGAQAPGGLNSRSRSTNGRGLPPENGQWNCTWIPWTSRRSRRPSSSAS